MCTPGPLFAHAGVVPTALLTLDRLECVGGAWLTLASSAGFSLLEVSPLTLAVASFVLGADLPLS